MSTGVSAVGSRALGWPLARVRLGRWSAAAWGAIATTALFLAITCWWLTQDRSIPIFDAGLHLQLAQQVHDELAAGHLGKALTLSVPYPPFSYLVAAGGIAIGGAGVAPPIIAENLVFVTLLALGCYHVGRLAFGSTAGFLAVVFALGSPLITSIFHVVMIDGPETAMVAVTLWAILATERFSRIGVSALAGLCAGLGMLTKEPFAFFIAGALLMVFLRGGWRNWRGLLAFAGVGLLVALPWYISEYSVVHAVGASSVQAQSGGGYAADIAPERFSLDNLEWYGWNLLNFQLFLPMFLFATVGWVWVVSGLLRRRSVSPLAPELVVGAFVSWLAITETFAHDTRYSMPLLVYPAVFAAAWIARMPRRLRVVLASLLLLVAAANTAGNILGAGEDVRLTLPGANTSFRQNPGIVTLFAAHGFLAGTPSRDGDILTTLKAMRHDGFRVIVVQRKTLFESDFSEAGLSALAQIAGLRAEIWAGGSPTRLTAQYGVLFHGPPEAVEGEPCVELQDGTDVWILRGDPSVANPQNYCPQ